MELYVKCGMIHKNHVFFLILRCWKIIEFAHHSLKSPLQTCILELSIQGQLICLMTNSTVKSWPPLEEQIFRRNQDLVGENASGSGENRQISPTRLSIETILNTIMIWCHTKVQNRYSLKFNSSPMKNYRNPIGKDPNRLPTTIFQGRKCQLPGCTIYISMSFFRRIFFSLWSRYYFVEGRWKHLRPQPLHELHSARVPGCQLG